MKTIFSNVRAKLDTDRGESIAEVLIAMLVIELALLMVVSMIMSAGKIIKNSEKGFNAYYAEKNAMETNSTQAVTENGTTLVTYAPTTTPGTVVVQYNDETIGSSASASVRVRKTSNGTLELYEPVPVTPVPTTPPSSTGG